MTTISTPIRVRASCGGDALFEGAIFVLRDAYILDRTMVEEKTIDRVIDGFAILREFQCP